jgi:hypothetical protein
MRPRQFTQELPASFVIDPIARTFELLACPKNRSLGADIESVRIKHRPLVVITEQCDLTYLADSIDAFPRIWAITDDVAQAEDLGNSLRLDVFEHYLQGFQVPMDIADQSTTHRGGTSDRNGQQMRKPSRTFEF